MRTSFQTEQNLKSWNITLECLFYIVFFNSKEKLNMQNIIDFFCISIEKKIFSFSLMMPNYVFIWAFISVFIVFFITSVISCLSSNNSYASFIKRNISITTSEIRFIFSSLCSSIYFCCKIFDNAEKFPDGVNFFTGYWQAQYIPSRRVFYK